MDFRDAAGLGFAADDLERARDFKIIEPFAGVGVKLLKPRAHERAGKIVRHQPAHDARLDDVLAHPCETGPGRLEIRGQHVAGDDAVFDHLVEAHVRRHHRIDLGAIDPRHEKYGVVHLLKQGEELRREDVSLARHQRHRHAVSTPERGAML